MKLDISEFVVENEALAATESGVIYNGPRSGIEEAWDRLALHYMNRASKESRPEVSEKEFYTHLAHARAENENAVTMYNLCGTVLRTYESHEHLEELGNIKNHIARELGTMLDKRISELEDNIQEEDRVFQEVRGHKREVKVSRSQLQIYTGPLEYVEFGAGNYSKATGLSCKIQFKGMEVSGYYRKPFSNPFEEHGVFLLEDRLIGKYEKLGLTVLIQRERMESSNEVCAGLLSELFCGRDIWELIPKLPVFISRFYLRGIIEKCVKRELIETDTKALCDGVSSVFYVKTESFVVKVDRSDNDMTIFINGCIWALKSE